MTESKRSRSVIFVILGSVVILGMVCCGIPAGLIDRYILLHIHSYEQTSSANISDVSITIQVNPQDRFQGPPERITGPPYALSVILLDPTRSAVQARLHSFDMRLDDGQIISGNISVDDSKWKEGLNLTILYVQFENNELGYRPTAVADIEIVYPDQNSERQILEIPLRATHRRTIHIP